MPLAFVQGVLYAVNPHHLPQASGAVNAADGLQVAGATFTIAILVGRGVHTLIQICLLFLHELLLSLLKLKLESLRGLCLRLDAGGPVVFLPSTTRLLLLLHHRVVVGSVQRVLRVGGAAAVEGIAPIQRVAVLGLVLVDAALAYGLDRVLPEHILAPVQGVAASDSLNPHRVAAV